MRLSVDRARFVLAPAETARAAEVAVRVRASLLPGDPATGPAVLDHLAMQVRSGLDAIWFWGTDSEVARLRAVMADPPAVLPRLDLGTTSVLSVEDEFGPGYGEVCRFRGLESSSPVQAPTTWQTTRHHTLVQTARDTGADRSATWASPCPRFWGYLPCRLALRDGPAWGAFTEDNRDQNDVLRALIAGSPWHFAQQAAGSFAADLAEVNFGHRPEIIVSPAGSADGGGHRGYQVLMPRTAALTSATHATVRPARMGDPSVLALSTAVRQVLRLWSCCCSVHLPLTDPDTIPAQRWLADHGFRLSAVVPPKQTWLVTGGHRRDVEVPPTGVWTRPGNELPVTRYLSAHTEAEETISGYFTF